MPFLLLFKSTMTKSNSRKKEFTFGLWFHWVRRVRHGGEAWLQAACMVATKETESRERKLELG